MKAAPQLLQHDANCFMRRMREADFVQVLAIERASFPDPWSRQLFMRELLLPSSTFWVFLADDAVAGYIGYWTIDGEVQIVNIAVELNMRKRGIARAMLTEAMQTMKASGAREVYLEVRSRNNMAQGLYASCGFEIIGRRKNYYLPDGDDAILMRKSLIQYMPTNGASYPCM